MTTDTQEDRLTTLRRLMSEAAAANQWTLYFQLAYEADLAATAQARQGETGRP